MTVFTVLDSETGQIMLSIILGLGLAALFQRVCNEEKCMIYKSPDEKLILGRVFTQNGKCYKYERQVVNCTGAAANMQPKQNFLNAVQGKLMS